MRVPIGCFITVTWDPRSPLRHLGKSYPSTRRIWLFTIEEGSSENNIHVPQGKYKYLTYEKELSSLYFLKMSSIKYRSIWISIVGNLHELMPRRFSVPLWYWMACYFLYCVLIIVDYNLGLVCDNWLLSSFTDINMKMSICCPWYRLFRKKSTVTMEIIL